jgi:tetratricopeptide (TPR) repeat protein
MSETITRNISSGFSYMTMDEDGILMSGRWTLGLGALIATFTSVADYAVEKGMISALLMGGMEYETLEEVDYMQEEIDFIEEEEPLDEELEVGFQLMEAEQYATADKVLSSWLQSHPGHGLAAEALANRGYCRMAQKQYETAIADYKKVMAIDPGYTPLACYNIACAYSVLEMKGKALSFLNKAIEAGFDDFDHMANDPDLDNIRDLITIPPQEPVKKASKPVKRL